MAEDDLLKKEFCNVIKDMTASMSSAREIVKSLRERQADTGGLDTKDGLSLLSIKHHLLLSYMQSLTLVSARRALGHPMANRSPPSLPFSSAERGPRGSGVGDLVDYMVETRTVLEKTKVLESKMKYQIEKLVSLAEETPSGSQKVLDDPLSFRPDPQNFIDDNVDGSADENEDGAGQPETNAQDGIYRPPRVAAMPYTGASRDKKSRRLPVPSALAALTRQDPSKPVVETTSGLGSTPSLTSNRTREIQRMTEFEEENFTRLFMNKKDMKRRLRDEENIALGGTGGASGIRRGGGGLEDEFEDVLRSVGRSKAGMVGDGYEELRERGKREGVLDRSRTRPRDKELEIVEEDPRSAKRSRFEKETKVAKRKLLKSKKPV